MQLLWKYKIKLSYENVIGQANENKEIMKVVGRKYKMVQNPEFGENLVNFNITLI